MQKRVMVRAISLPGDSRRELLKRPMCSSIDFSFFDASNNWDLDSAYSQSLACVHKGRPLSVPELGCYASHLRLWQHFLDSPYDYLLAMEDDVTLDWDAVYYLLSKDSILSLGGIMRLFARYPACHRVIGHTECRFITRIFYYASGTQAYIVDKATAGALSLYCRIPSRPIDDQLDREWDHGIPTYAIYPFPAYEAIGPSRISVADPAAHRLSSSQMAKRILYRFGDTIKFVIYWLIVRIKGWPNRWYAFD